MAGSRVICGSTPDHSQGSTCMEGVALREQGRLAAAKRLRQIQTPFWVFNHPYQQALALNPICSGPRNWLRVLEVVSLEAGRPIRLVAPILLASRV